MTSPREKENYRAREFQYIAEKKEAKFLGTAENVNKTLNIDQPKLVAWNIAE